MEHRADLLQPGRDRPCQRQPHCCRGGLVRPDARAHPGARGRPVLPRGSRSSRRTPRTDRLACPGQSRRPTHADRLPLRRMVTRHTCQSNRRGRSTHAAPQPGCACTVRFHAATAPQAPGWGRPTVPGRSVRPPRLPDPPERALPNRRSPGTNHSAGRGPPKVPGTLLCRPSW